MLSGRTIASRTLVGSMLVASATILWTCAQKPTEVAPLETGIAGRVLDQDNSAAIPNALVTTSPITSSVTTDQSGSYAIQNVAPGQYVVSAAKAGYSSASINVSVVEGKTSSADIELKVLGPQLGVSVTNIDFGASQTVATFTITNSTGVGSLNWSISANANWINVSPTNGTLTTAPVTVTATVNRTGLSYGNYSTLISIATNYGNKDIPVTMTAVDPNAPRLAVTPAGLDFDSVKTQLNLSISNAGAGTLNWSLAGNQTWMSASPSTGVNGGTALVTVSRSGLSAGTYTGTISVTSNGGSASVSVSMKVPVPTSIPILGVTPLSLDFDSLKTQLSLAIANSGGGTLSWSLTGNQTWISASPSSGVNGGTTMVTVSRSGLSVGSYTGQVSVTSNAGNLNVPVAMKVPSIVVPAPVANFVGTPLTGILPLAVQFTDQSAGTISAWSWDFGDGGSSSDQNPQHTYLTKGAFTVKLQVSGPGGSNQKIRTSYVSASAVLFYESFDSLTTWADTGFFHAKWVTTSGYGGYLPYKGACAISQSQGYGAGGGLSREVTIAESGTLHLWVWKLQYDAVTIYLYVDGALQWSWGGGTTWGSNWTEKTSPIAAGIHTISIETDLGGTAMIDELTITSP